MPDNEALKLTLKLVEQAAEVEFPTPEELGWEQAEWFTTKRLPNGYGIRTLEQSPMCVTAGCFAGHYAFSQGFTEPVDSGPGGIGIRNPTTGQTLWVGHPDSMAETISSFAQEGLGLDPDQAEWLFCATNTLEDLQMIVDDLSEGDDA